MGFLGNEPGLEFIAPHLMVKDSGEGNDKEYCCDDA